MSPEGTTLSVQTLLKANGADSFDNAFNHSLQRIPIFCKIAVDNCLLWIVKAYLNSIRIMKDGERESLEDLSCELLAGTRSAQVAIRSAIRKEYDRLETQQRARFHRMMEMWCDGHALPSTMLNHNEGRTPGNLMLKAFKAFKIRLYGFERSVRGKKTFIIVDLDPQKKQDKADPGILKRARGRADEIGKGTNE